MPIGIDPPTDDQEASRHRFYAVIASALDNNTTAMMTIGTKLEEIIGKHGAVAQDFRDLQTTIRTTIRLASFLVVAFGTIGGMVLKEAWDVSARVSKLEQSREMFLYKFKAHEDLPEQTRSISTRVERLEAQAQSHHVPQQR